MADRDPKPENIVLTDLPAVQAQPKITVNMRVVPRPCPYCGEPIAHHENYDTGATAVISNKGPVRLIHFVHRDPPDRPGLVAILHVRFQPCDLAAAQEEEATFKAIMDAAANGPIKQTHAEFVAMVERGKLRF